MLPGPQATGQVVGVQNSDIALVSRLMFLKNAIAAAREQIDTDT